MSEQPSLIFDPTALTEAQRSGTACAVCQKTWPIPDTVVGRLPDSGPVYACTECAAVLRVGHRPGTVHREDPSPQP